MPAPDGNPSTSTFARGRKTTETFLAKVDNRQAKQTNGFPKAKGATSLPPLAPDGMPIGGI